MEPRRQIDKELLIQVVENTRDLRHLEGDVRDMKEVIDDIKAEVSEVRDEMRGGFQAQKDISDAILRRLDANANQLRGASKLAVILMKAWPIAVTAVGAFLGGKYIQ